MEKLVEFIQVNWKENGKSYQVPKNYRIIEMIKYIQKEEEIEFQSDKLVAVLKNHILTSLNEFIKTKSVILEPIYKGTIESRQMYAETLTFLMGMSSYLEFPNSICIIEYQSGNGYQCILKGVDEMNDEIINRLKKRMYDLIDQNLMLTKELLSYEESIYYFKKINRPYSVNLIESKNLPEIHVNTCQGKYYSLYRSPLFISTKMIEKDFDIEKNSRGFLLKFSNEFNYDKIDYFNKSLLPIYQESSKFGSKFNKTCVGLLNKTIHQKKQDMKDFISLCEAVHDRNINEISSKFEKLNEINKKKLLLIAGPSASNKTTFAKKLCIQLMSRGYKTVVLSVDDYYKAHKDCPKDDHGNYNFEVIEALRTDLLNQHISDLIQGKEIEMPRFDFKNGKPFENGIKTSVEKDSIIVMEGIHCLNDELTKSISNDLKFKVFVAPFSQMNIDETTCVQNSTNRLCRRMVRDYKTRGHTPKKTLQMWSLVRKGEHKYIFPFMDSADSIFNSSLEYEIPILKVYLMPLLTMISPSDEHYNQSRDLLSFLDNFHSLYDEMIPSESLLREFIGNSFYDE